MRNMIQGSFLLIAGLAAVVVAAPQEDGSAAPWEIPEEERAVANPVEASPEVIAQGMELYKKNCLMCHGEAFKGDGPATQYIKPSPADLSGSDVRERLTDGEIFYKITVGKRPMPPMNRKLSEEERWKLVHYVRSLQVN